MPRFLLYILYICALTAGPAAAQPFAEQKLSQVLPRIGKRFGVEIVCKRFSADTVRVRYPAFRVRPYSLTETLDNLLRPLDLVWSGEGKITVQPYEYYRRTPADGAKLLDWLGSKYDDRALWEHRRDSILLGAREALALEPFTRGLVRTPDVHLDAVRYHDGYTTQNYALETLPGLYVCGTIYAFFQPPLPGENRIPAGRRLNPRRGRPLVVVPSGHWPEGRYRADHQLLMASLARMGAVAVDMDIFGWGESGMQVGREAHTTPYSMQMQVLWSKAVTDWIVASRSDIDTTRMAATGGSGGATHALLLAVIDPRFSVLAPVVHLVSHFDGGCACENGRPLTLAAHGTCMPELLAAACAPRPVLCVSDGGDWTATYPTLEYPFLQRIWGFYGASDNVRNVHFADERHDFGPSKRRAVYTFFGETLGLHPAMADESKADVMPAESLQTFHGTLPAKALHSRGEMERLLNSLE